MTPGCYQVCPLIYTSKGELEVHQTFYGKYRLFAQVKQTQQCFFPVISGTSPDPPARGTHWLWHFKLGDAEWLCVSQFEAVSWYYRPSDDIPGSEVPDRPKLV